MSLLDATGPPGGALLRPPPAAAPTGRRAPLLALLVPLLAGILARDALPQAAVAIPAAWTLLALGLALVAAAGAALRPEGRIARAAVVAAAFAAGWASAGRAGHLPEARWSGGEREAVIDVRVDRVFLREDGTPSGALGIVRRAPADAPGLVGTRVHVALARAGPASPGEATGATWRVRGVLAEPEPDAPGFAGWLLDQGVTVRLRRARAIAEVEPASDAERARARWLARAEGWLTRGAPPGDRGPRLVAAAFLGRKHLLDDDALGVFTRTGTLHLFAVSGLHVGLAAALAAATLALFRVPRVVALAASVAVALGYAWLCGLPPSAVRAALLVGLVAAAEFARRQRGAWPALVAAGLAALVADPTLAGHAGFRLSYAVVAGLILYASPLGEAATRALDDALFRPGKQGLLRQGWSLGLRWLAGATACSLAAGVAGTGLSLGLFGFFAPGGVLLNLAFVPAGSLLVAGSMLVLGLSACGLHGVADWVAEGPALVAELLYATAVATESAAPWLFLPREAFHPALGPALTAATLGAMLLLGHDRLRDDPRARWIPVLVAVAGVALGSRPA